MPATAGRVRMPANNRVHSSAALQTHGIWQSAIGYDPYAPNKEEKKDKSAQQSAAAEPETENAYASFQGLLALARITGSNADEVRGSCKKCGRVGHLTFQCRNFLSAKDEGDKDNKDADAIQAAILSGLEKLKGNRLKVNGKNVSDSEESSEDETESSDSDYDSEMERLIAQKYGKSISGRKLSSKNRRKYDTDESDDDDGCESKANDKRKRERKERGRSKKRSSKRGKSESEDEDEGRRKRRKEKRRRRDDNSSDEDDERRRRRRKTRKEKHRRRSHRDSEDDSSDDSDEQRHKRRNNRRAASVSDSDDSRVGRHKKRSDKKRRHRHSSP